MNYNEDCSKFLDTAGRYDGVFLDPPDDLGLKYDGFVDTFPKGTYIPWLSELILKAMKHVSSVYCSLVR